MTKRFLTFEIRGHLTPWARPRSNGRRFFTAPKAKAYADLVTLAALEAKPRGWEPLRGPVSVEINAVFKRAAACRKHHKHGWHPVRPDIDNAALKLFLDAMNGIAYEDDGQVVHVECWKRCSVEPFVRVTVEELT